MQHLTTEVWELKQDLVVVRLRGACMRSQSPRELWLSIPLVCSSIPARSVLTFLLGETNMDPASARSYMGYPTCSVTQHLMNASHTPSTDCVSSKVALLKRVAASITCSAAAPSNHMRSMDSQSLNIPDPPPVQKLWATVALLQRFGKLCMHLRSRSVFFWSRLSLGRALLV
jgi:hypothetical protein